MGVDRDYWIGIEAGGTKFVCVAGYGPDEIFSHKRFSTQTPDETLPQANRFIAKQVSKKGKPKALGIASFGPIDLNPGSESYGCLLNTPKAEWQGVNMVKALASDGISVALDTDVNGAAITEQKWGASVDVISTAYVTVGTGLGVGIVKNGKSVTGNTHYEMGHLFSPRAEGDEFEGSCPFHRCCLEGLASGTAIRARWGKALSEFPLTHPAIDMEAEYLSYLAAAIFYVHGVERIVFGGGVMQTPGLLEKVQKLAYARCGGYGAMVETQNDFSNLIIAPGLGDCAGPIGALAIAMGA